MILLAQNKWARKSLMAICGLFWPKKGTTNWLYSPNHLFGFVSVPDWVRGGSGFYKRLGLVVCETCNNEPNRTEQMLSPSPRFKHVYSQI